MKRQAFYILFSLTALSSCLENPVMTVGIVNEKEDPTVATKPSDPFTDDDGSLVFQGELISKGKGDTIEKGFCWSTVSNNPGIHDNHIAMVSDTSVTTFTYKLTGVSGDTTYYWRAYAQNSYGCDYGEVQSCQTPAIWVAKQELPSDSRGRGAVFMLCNRIYITCGVKFFGQAFVGDTWEYSIASNQWAQSDSISFPGGNRDYPVVFTIGNLAFVGTGRQTSTLCFNDFYQFNADSKKWTTVATPNNLGARYEATAFSFNGNGYLVGGLTAAGKSAFNDVWQYNPVNNLWVKKNNFPSNFYGGIGISGANCAFAGFGDAAEAARTLWEYDDATDSWSVYAQLPPEATSKIYSGVIIQNTMYFMDGNYGIWALNMSNKTWKKKPANLPIDFVNETSDLVDRFQAILTTGNSNSIYVGLGFCNLLYEYHPLWDN